MRPDEVEREQEREEKDRFLDEAYKGGAVKDLVEFYSDLEDMNITYSNAHKVLNEYMSKRGNVNTFIHETYQQASEKESDVEDAKQNDRQLQGFIDDGWIPLEVHKDTVGAKEDYKKILQYAEQRDQIQMELIKELYEEVEKQRGADMAEEVMKEAREFLNETFEQKFESEEKKLEMVQDIVNDKLDDLDEKVERKENKLDERINEFEKSEKKMLNFMAQNLNAMKSMIDQMDSTSDVERDFEKVPNQLAEKMKEKDVFQHLDQDFMKRMDQKQQKASSDGKDRGSSDDLSTEPDQVEVETTETTQDSDDSDGDDDIDRTETPPDQDSEDGGDEDETDDERETKSEFDQLIHQIPHGASSIVVDVAKAIDAGQEEKQDIRDHLDTKNPAVPTRQINKMLDEGYVDEDDIPDPLLPDE